MYMAAAFVYFIQSERNLNTGVFVGQYLYPSSTQLTLPSPPPFLIKPSLREKIKVTTSRTPFVPRAHRLRKERRREGLNQHI